MPCRGFHLCLQAYVSCFAPFSFCYCSEFISSSHPSSLAFDGFVVIIVHSGLSYYLRLHLCAGALVSPLSLFGSTAGSHLRFEPRSGLTIPCTSQALLKQKTYLDLQLQLFLTVSSSIYADDDKTSVLGAFLCQVNLTPVFSANCVHSEFLPVASTPQLTSDSARVVYGDCFGVSAALPNKSLSLVILQTPSKCPGVTGALLSSLKVSPKDLAPLQYTLVILEHVMFCMDINHKRNLKSL